MLCVILLTLTLEFNLDFSLCSRNPKEENYELYCLKFPTSTPWRRRGLLSTTPTRCSWLASKAKPWVTWWDRGMQPREHDKKPVEVFIFQFSKSSTHRDNVMKLKKRQIKNRCWAVLLFFCRLKFFPLRIGRYDWHQIWIISNTKSSFFLLDVPSLFMEVVRVWYPNVPSFASTRWQLFTARFVHFIIVDRWRVSYGRHGRWRRRLYWSAPPYQRCIWWSG